MTIRVALVDDEAMVRVGLRMVLSAEADIEVVGEAADGGAAVAMAEETRPDVVLMDVRMPRVDGLEGSRRVLAAVPGTKVVVLTTFDEDAFVEGALRAGVSGFLLKVAPPERLIDAVRTVAAGGALLDPSVTVRVIESFTSGAPRPPAARGRARRAHRAREGRAPTRRAGDEQRGDRRGAVPRGDDGEDPRLLGAGQARAA